MDKLTDEDKSNILKIVDGLQAAGRLDTSAGELMISDDNRRSLHFQVALVGNDWTMLWQTEVTLPVLCASWPLLQGLCQSSRSLASFIPYVDFEFGLRSMAYASPLELVGIDRGCQISRVLSTSLSI